MIFIDYSQIVVASAFAFSSDFDKGKDTAKMVDILRHTVLTTLLSYKSKYGKQFGEIVIACDGRNYWRKEVFPYYKAHRKGDRAASKTDWSAIFSIASQLRDEFKEVFPYKFILVDRAEGDDVIAVLAKYIQTNELRVMGLVEVPQEVLILSSDGDYKQLHKYKNVKQWNPILKKYVGKPDQHFLLEKLLTGDAGDGVPNVRSVDNQLVEGIRQSPITAKIKSAAFAQREEGKDILFADMEMQRNYQRNRLLIDFDYIPQDITDAIIGEYLAQTPVRDKGKIFNYFMTHRMKLLMERIQEF